VFDELDSDESGLLDSEELAFALLQSWRQLGCNEELSWCQDRLLLYDAVEDAMIVHDETLSGTLSRANFLDLVTTYPWNALVPEAVQASLQELRASPSLSKSKEKRKGWPRVLTGVCDDASSRAYWIRLCARSKEGGLQMPLPGGRFEDVPGGKLGCDRVRIMATDAAVEVEVASNKRIRVRSRMI